MLSEETISALLAYTCKSYRGMAERLLGQAGLHVGQDYILLHLWETDGLTQSELGERLCVQAATITKMLDRMEGAGLLERRSDTHDQRVSRVYLTAQGQNVRQTVTHIRATMEQVLTAELSQEEQSILHRLLTQVRENILNHENPDSSCPSGR
jgi:MarR family transcriptional regulator, organic hydroperoxide resistance regulator